MEIIPACINCKHIKRQYGVLYCDVDKSRVEESDCCDGDNWNFESIFKLTNHPLLQKGEGKKKKI